MPRITLIIMIVSIALSCAPRGQVPVTDKGPLPRDYRVYHEVKPVKPEVIAGGDMAWITVDPNLRRKVYFNDRQTLVLNEWTNVDLGKDPAPERHANELTGYVLEGSLMVTIDKQARSLGTGGVFIIPSNVRYTLLPLTARVLYLAVFTPARDDLRRPLPPVRFDENDIKSLVYQWFSHTDKSADAERLTPFLADKPLTIRFPRVLMKTREDFRTWYGADRGQTKSLKNTVEEIQVEIDKNNNYIVTMTVSRRAVTILDEDRSSRSRQAWVFTDQGGTSPVITYMDVQESDEGK